MKKSIVGVFVITGFLFTSGFAQARGAEKRGMMKKMFEQLELSEEQIAKLKEFRKSRKEKEKPEKGKMKELMQKMANAFISNAPDDELKAIHSEIQSAKGSKVDHRLEKMIFMKNLLTKEQREKFIELRKKDFRKQFKKHRE